MILRVGPALRFLPAAVTVRVAPSPRVTPVPGAPRELVGIAVHEGAVVPVLSVGDARDEMVVCQHAGELVGIVGGRVVGTGTYDAVAGTRDIVDVDGALVQELDVGQLYAHVQTRSGRWG